MFMVSETQDKRQCENGYAIVTVLMLAHMVLFVYILLKDNHPDFQVIFSFQPTHIISQTIAANSLPFVPSQCCRMCYCVQTLVFKYTTLYFEEYPRLVFDNTIFLNLITVFLDCAALFLLLYGLYHTSNALAIFESLLQPYSYQLSI